MEAAIVYYSRTGNTGQAAQMIVDEIMNRGERASLIELKSTSKISFGKAGSSATMHRELPMKDADTDLGKYDTVIIGSPVWARRPAPFIWQYMEQAQNTEGKKGACFVTCMGMSGKASERMRRILRDAGITPVAALDLNMKKTDKNQLREQIRVFVDKVLSE